MITVKVKKMSRDALLPIRATSGSACYDVRSTVEADIPPGERLRIPTGLAFELPEGVALDIRPRSGLASDGLIILNSPGTLDSDYRGQLLISVQNISEETIYIEKGQRVAQIRPFLVHLFDFKLVDELEPSPRDTGGFGSTGK